MCGTSQDKTSDNVTSVFSPGLTQISSHSHGKKFDQWFGNETSKCLCDINLSIQFFTQ